MSDIEKIHGITPDLTKENVDKLLALFPEVATEITNPQTGATERAVDFDALKERLGDVAEGNRERYQFTWPGKREAKRLASPSPRPCGQSRNAARIGTPRRTSISRATTSTH